MQKITLEEVIRNHVHLGRPNQAGWLPVLCKVCNDSGKKGLRAAFRFDGDTCGYNCFNCSHTALYNPTEHRSMPHKMMVVLDSFGIPDTDWQSVIFSALSNQSFSSSPNQKQYVSIEPNEIEFPSSFIRLTNDTEDDISLYAIEYLKQERGINWDTYPFYVANDPTNKRWYGRLIIPIYKDNKIIFFQGRDLSGMAIKKYLSPTVPRDNVMYGYENLHMNVDEPLYVVEGFFDAFLLNGVALFGNKLTEAHIKWLNQSRRKKVIIPDKFGDGQLLANAAIEQGWSVSTPDAAGCKDITDVVNKYGMLYTLKTIHDNTAEGFAASTAVALYCKKEPK